MRIACIGARAIPGVSGIDTALSELAPRLVSLGHDVTLFARTPYTGKNTANLTYKGVTIKPFPCLKNKYLETPTYTAAVVLHCMFSDYDIYFFHAVVTGLFIPFLKLFGKTVVLETHGLDWKRGKWNWFAKLVIVVSAYLGVRFSDKTVSVTPQEVEYFKSRFGRDAEHIPNGTSLEVTSSTSELENFNLSPQRYVLFLSRLVPEKGVHFLMDAWEGLEKSIKGEFKLAIAGDTTYKDKYYQSILQRRSDEIVFTGHVTGETKSQLLCHALALVQPSTMEGMPMSVLEAKGLGIPVILSDIPELKAIASDDDLVFKSGDSDDLRRVLVNLFRDYGRHRKAALEAKEIVLATYGWDVIAKKFDVLFRRLKGT